MKKKGTRRCLHQDTKSLITPSLHLCFALTCCLFSVVCVCVCVQVRWVEMNIPFFIRVKDDNDKSPPETRGDSSETDES